MYGFLHSSKGAAAAPVNVLIEVLICACKSWLHTYVCIKLQIEAHEDSKWNIKQQYLMYDSILVHIMFIKFMSDVDACAIWFAGNWLKVNFI